jgi:hypothetical protein
MATRQSLRLGTLRRLNREVQSIFTSALSVTVAFGITAIFTAASAGTMLHGHLEEMSMRQPAMNEQKLSVSSLPNSFPYSFAGVWRCETTVVDSGVSAILPGQKSVSEISFKHAPDGRTVASWAQPGWTEAEASQVSFSAEKARVDRTNYYWADGVKGAWAARSRDDFTRVSDNQMISKSYIDQYVDGQYVGRYRTTSVLYRISDADGMCKSLKESK